MPRTTIPPALAPISIIVPMKNESERIGTLLTALTKQTIPPQELIIVDNNSSDDSIAKARHFAPVFSKLGCTFTILSELRPGVAVTRNTGAATATTRLLGFIDADCVPTSTWCATACTLTPPTPAFAGKIIMHDAPWLVRTLTELGWYKWYFSVLQYFCGFHSLTTANCVVSREAFKHVGGFNESLHSINDLEDVELAAALTLLNKNHQVQYCDELVVSSSFRRYASPRKAMQATLARFQRLIAISRKFQHDQKIRPQLPE